MDKKPIIAITMGDPSGVGPEVIAKSFMSERMPDCHFVVIGSSTELNKAIKMIGSSYEAVAISSLTEQNLLRQSQNENHHIPVLNPQLVELKHLKYGQVSKEAGKASIEWVLEAAKMASNKTVDAMVTGPIHKEACVLAGYKDIGHMEILQKYANSPLVATMLVANNLRVVHMSTHKSLAKAVEYCTRGNVLDKIKLTDTYFKKWGFESPKIGVAALNPHASDGGLIGNDEETELIPAILDARSQGINVEGPIPADTIFNKGIKGEYDAILAMYHDQGHIAIKVYDWAKSISVNLGLPFIRTSVDHGTAFDIAGKGIADPTNMLEAILVAYSIAGNGILPTKMNT
jgi:4-hydroxythreonine-4-phosphate dehydrogenase